MIKPSITMMELETRIREIFSMARLCGKSSEDLSKEVNEKIMAPLNSCTNSGKRRHSVWFAGYGAGVIAAHRTAIWQQVEFCYRDKDGKIYSTSKTTKHASIEELYRTNRGHEISGMESAHLWIERGTPYTKWRKI